MTTQNRPEYVCGRTAKKTEHQRLYAMRFGTTQSWTCNGSIHGSEAVGLDWNGSRFRGSFIDWIWLVRMTDLLFGVFYYFENICPNAYPVQVRFTSLGRTDSATAWHNRWFCELTCDSFDAFSIEVHINHLCVQTGWIGSEFTS